MRNAYSFAQWCRRICAEEWPPAISQQSLLVLSSLAYHDYEGLALNEEEKPRLVRDLGRDRDTARATVGQGLAVSAFPRYVPV